MKSIIKIKLSAYKKLIDDKLVVFANALLENGKSKTFDPYRTILDTLTTATNDYATKLQKAQNRGKIEIAEKNISKETLLVGIDMYAYQINSAAMLDSSIIVRAGFESQSNATRSNGDFQLNPPFGLTVELSKNSGEVYLTCQLDDSKRVVKNGVEWSEDNGVLWNNGTYFSGKKGTVKHLPIHKDLLIRIRSLGTFNKESGFSVPIPVFCLNL